MNTDLVLDFHFEEEPRIKERQPVKGMTKQELTSIKRFPFMVVKSVNYDILLNIHGKKYIFSGTIPKGFCYNMADIPDVLQPISYDKHSPFVKTASLIHDYLLVNKFRLYEKWKLAELGLTFSEFRDVTSNVFRIELENSAVPVKKASLMAKAVNLWQRLIFPLKQKLHDEQKEPEDKE